MPHGLCFVLAGNRLRLMLFSLLGLNWYIFAWQTLRVTRCCFFILLLFLLYLDLGAQTVEDSVTCCVGGWAAFFVPLPHR